MTQTQTLLMEMGQLTLIIALFAFFAVATIGTVWLWSIAIWRVIDQRESDTALREFLAWKRAKELQKTDPAETPAACECLSMGHPEQCAMQPGCRWLKKLHLKYPLGQA